MDGVKIKALVISENKFLEGIVNNEKVTQELINDNIPDRLEKLNSNPVDIIFLDKDSEENIINKVINVINKEQKNPTPPIFVVYNDSDYKIRADIWEIPSVIGYSEKGAEDTTQDIKEVIDELYNRKVLEEDSTDHICIGDKEKISPEDYERFKFISLTVGNMRRFMIDFKDVLREIKVTGHGQKPASDPFLGIPAKTWLTYMDSRLNPPTEESLKKHFSIIRKEIYKVLKSDDREIDSIPATAIQDEELEEKFKEIFCNESLVRRENVDHVLIEGDTGTGKSLIADMLHRFSTGGESSDTAGTGYMPKLQKITSTNIPDNLLEGELFGHMRGAFTGAIDTAPGRIVNAYNGIIFLDEIGDMSPQLQAKILTFLDDGRIEPTGWRGSAIHIPARVVAATNKNLLEECKKKNFREDLFYRFTHRIKIPPLKERKEDMDLLIGFILQNPIINPVIDGNKRFITHISAEAVKKIKEHDYPGNFRELESTLLEAAKKVKRLGSSSIIPQDIIFHDIPNTR